MDLYVTTHLPSVLSVVIVMYATVEVPLSLIVCYYAKFTKGKSEQKRMLSYPLRVAPH